MDFRPGSNPQVRSEPKRALDILLAVAPAAALFLFHATRYGTWLIDDAGISFAYARNLAAGFGLVAQPGETPIEGFSNPLWTLLVALLSFVKLFSIPYVPKILGALLVLGAFCAFAAAVLRVLPRIEASIVAGLSLAMTAANPGFVVWCVSGLENPLLVFLAACLLLTSLRAMQAAEQSFSALCIQAGLLAAGLALTRPDALLYAAVFPLASILRSTPLPLSRLRKCTLVYGVSFAVPLGAYLLFRRAYFHDWLPNTYYAKPGVSLVALREVVDASGFGFLRLGDLAHGIFPAMSLIALLAPFAALIAAVLSWQQPHARATLLIAAFLVTAYVSYLVLPQDWMGEYRFATIAFPLTSLLVLLLLQQVLAASRLITAKRTLLVVGGVGFLLVSAPNFALRSHLTAQSPVVPLETVAATNSGYNELATRLHIPDATALLPDLGGALLVSRLRVVDMAGLCDRELGRMYFSNQSPAAFASHVLRKIKPDLVHIHGYWIGRTGLLASEEFVATYLDLGDGDYVRRESLPHGMSDEAARSVKTQLTQSDRVADLH